MEKDAKNYDNIWRQKELVLIDNFHWVNAILSILLNYLKRSDLFKYVPEHFGKKKLMIIKKVKDPMKKNYCWKLFDIILEKNHIGKGEYKHILHAKNN